MLAALLRFLRRAGLIGGTVTGIYLGFAVNRGDVGAALLYGLLFALCASALLLKPANQRPNA